LREKLLTGLLVLVFIAVPLFAAACEGEEVTPPAQQEEEEEEEEVEWWEAKWGEPQYGGTVTLHASSIRDYFFDACDPSSITQQFWQESLFGHNMTTDRDIYSFSLQEAPTEYRTGWLAERWEISDSTTIVVHLHQGIQWQDKPPVNGREFTAYDVEYTYNRLMGSGSGFTERLATYPIVLSAIEKVTATDKYTVEFKIKILPELAIYEVMGPALGFGVVAQEWVELGEEGQQDWHNAVGTGPFILTEFTPGTSITCSRNPDYWGYDERYPENQLPYLDEVKILVIPDMATALSALRSGTLDIIASDRSHITTTQALSLANTNPEIQQAWWPGLAWSACFKYNTPPFDDIRVRKAMQLAVNIPEIAETLKKGTVEGVPVSLVSTLFGEDWVVPYDKWPAELQAEYSYNPDGARALLAEAAADGVFEPNSLGGFDCNILASTTDDMELLQTIQSYFQDIGVVMDIQAVDQMTFYSLAHSQTYDYMTFASVGGLVNAPPSAIMKYTPNSAQNTGGVNDPAYTALAEQFLAATTLAEAQQLFKEADRYMLEQHWGVSMCANSNPQVWQPWVKGYSGEFFWTVWQLRYFAYMWIDQS
jgi:peptide/nickel transport system substrate-binding protein